MTALPTSGPEHRSEVVVTAREVAADGVVALTLADPSGADLPAWAPGAHVDVLLGDSLERQYSLCGSPRDRSSWRIGVLLEPGGRGGSARVHELQVGERLTVRGPRNHFPLLPASRHVFIAGGIGITPILPMTAASTAAGSDWHLWYGGRTRSSMAFLDELDPARVTVCPQDETGLLPLAEILGDPGADTLVYCCGPEPLLAAVEQACGALPSLPSGALRVERFSPKPQDVPAGGDTAFEVECRRSGLTVVVPADRSILETLEEHGVDVISSCQEGVCGTCETAVVEGVPEHRDSLLSEDERAANDYMMICVGRARSERLVLDL